MRNRCKIHLPEIEYVKMAQRGLDIESRKKFQGIEFRDFYELTAKVTDMKNYSRNKINEQRPPWELTAMR